MNLKPIYRSAAGVVALAALVVALYPSTLLWLTDSASASTNADHIVWSFWLFAIWFAAVSAVLVRTAPSASYWPPLGPLWPHVAWLALCVAYTVFEHGWLGFPPYVYEEDGILETATAILLLVSVVGFGLCARIAAAAGRRAAAAILATMAVLCFLFMMEELSWGQRIFGWDTPEGIERINAQNETNLHNVFQGANQLFRLVVAIVGASILIWSDRMRAWLEPYGLSILLPDRRHVYFAPFLLYAHVYDELFEEVMALFLIIYMLEMRRRLIRV